MLPDKATAANAGASIIAKTIWAFLIIDIILGPYIIEV